MEEVVVQSTPISRPETVSGLVDLLSDLRSSVQVRACMANLQTETKFSKSCVFLGGMITR